MDTLREVVIDEARWPRMFAKLRRAGMYSTCGCAGCTSCQRAAKRFVRGIGRHGAIRAPSGIHAQWNRGGYGVVSQSVGDGVLHVLINGDEAPTISDLAYTSYDIETEVPLRDVVNAHLTWQLTPAKRRDLLSAWGEDRSRDVWMGPARLFGFPERLTSEQRASLKRPGLYLIYWPTGHYVGKAEAQSLESRIGQHVREIRSMCGSSVKHQVFWLPLNPNQGIKAREEKLHRNIIEVARRTVGDPRKLSQEQLFRIMGFTNAKIGGEI